VSTFDPAYSYDGPLPGLTPMAPPPFTPPTVEPPRPQPAVPAPRAAAEHTGAVPGVGHSGLVPGAVQASAYTPTPAYAPQPGAGAVAQPAAPAPAQPYQPTFAPIATPVAPPVAPQMAPPAAPPPVAVAAAAPVAVEEAAPAGRLGMEQGPGNGPGLADLLLGVLERGASDLHMTANAPPTYRVHGHLYPMDDAPVLTPQGIQQMLYQVLTQKQRERFEENLELDFSYALPGQARFRVNVYRQRDSLGAAFRIIPHEIKPLEELKLPPQIGNFASLPRGFVLVTGPTGSGKSTTLAAIVDLANRTRRDHIMTVEDPIEFLHQHRQCVVNQREVGEDTLSFANALKHALRQDPDIILVGEMRDLETIGVALTAAETGHLVFGTLHTQDAAQTVDRVIDVFPPHQQQQIRVQLAGALQGVVCQTLCKTTDGRGRVVASEVMVATPAIRNLIREGKTHQMHSAMQAGAKYGMVTIDQSLADLVRQKRITYEAGVEKCHHLEDFNRLCGRA